MWQEIIKVLSNCVASGVFSLFILNDLMLTINNKPVLKDSMQKCTSFKSNHLN